jgi:hypothetical protein
MRLPMRRLLVPAAFALLSVPAGDLTAQGTISVTFQGSANPGNPNAMLGGVQNVGPFNMQRNSPTNVFQAYCIDFDNTVVANQTWTARVVSIATLATSSTDFNAFVRVLGTSATAGNLGNSFTTANTDEWMKRLRASGYLSDLMVGTPNTSWDETQFAIWTLFSSATAPNPSDLTASNNLRSTALTYAQNNPTKFGDWKVLIDNNAYNTSYTGKFAQAYMTKSMVVVPEPATYGLVATGLVALGAVVRRRRRAAGKGADMSPDRSH